MFVYSFIFLIKKKALKIFKFQEQKQQASICNLVDMGTPQLTRAAYTVISDPSFSQNVIGMLNQTCAQASLLESVPKKFFVNSFIAFEIRFWLLFWFNLLTWLGWYNQMCQNSTYCINQDNAPGQADVREWALFFTLSINQPI